MSFEFLVFIACYKISMYSWLDGHMAILVKFQKDLPFPLIFVILSSFSLCIIVSIIFFDRWQSSFV